MYILCLYIHFVNRLHQFQYLKLIFNFNVDFMSCGLFILLLWLMCKFCMCTFVYCSVRNLVECCLLQYRHCRWGWSCKLMWQLISNSRSWPSLLRTMMPSSSLSVSVLWGRNWCFSRYNSSWLIQFHYMTGSKMLHMVFSFLYLLLPFILFMWRINLILNFITNRSII